MILEIPTIPFFLLPVFFSLHVALAALPQVDFDRMGKVGLAGDFAGLDLFQNSTSVAAFDPATSTLFSRTADGALTRLASTNSGGRILAGCALGDVFYLGGSFSSIGGTTASNVASYTPSTGVFAALGSNGPNGQVDSIFCDEKNNKVWVGGPFTSPASAVAVWDVKSITWSKPPFSGLTGAEARVLSITSNSSRSSLFFAGSFITSFQGNGSGFNSTNNPNVPFSPGATPFSSTLVPIPLENAQVDGGPSSTDPQFNDIKNVLCPSGPDGPGNTWFAADGIEAVVTIRKFKSVSANGVRLGNTFLQGRGTTTFSVTTIPDNTVQALTYVDPASGQNHSCTHDCPLSTDSSVLYQDFLFPTTLGLTGVQIKLSEWTGPGPGLHILQLLSSGAFASALSGDNGQSCFAPNSSTTSYTGSWTGKVANTNIAGTTQSTLTASVDVGTPAAQAPSFTWMPYVSGSGQYTINLLVPGCTNFQDCDLRTTVKVTVFPGQGIDPWVSTISQQNSQDAVVSVYSGPIIPSSPNFVTTVEMTLADNPVGTGRGGKYEMVADRVQLILTSVSDSSSVTSGNNGPGSTGGRKAFGFFEWPLSITASVDGTGTLSNSSETSLDAIGFSMFNSAGGNSLTAPSTTAIVAVVHHPSGIVYIGGNFTLSSGTASGAANVVAFKNGVLATLPADGLNGPVSSLVLSGDKLFVGGSFTDTNSPSSQGKIRGVTMYDVNQNTWVPMQAGVNGGVTSLGLSNGRIQIAGNFTTILDTPTGTSGPAVGGFAAWDVNLGRWVNSGGYLVGSMTFVGNGTTPSRGKQQQQFVAGNVVSSHKFGASGLVMLKNGGADGPEVSPLGVQLENGNAASFGANTNRRRSHVRRGPVTWIPNISNMFSRQTTGQLAPLPSSQPALAPSILAGAFWTNVSSSHELVVVGGNFSFTASPGTVQSSAVGLYDPTSITLTALQGTQLNGTVRSLLVQGNTLYIGGEFSLSGTTANGFAIYDLAKQQWTISNLQALQGGSGTTVVVRSITASPAKPQTIIVAGSFAQAGSLRCQSICALDTQSMQWNTLGNGIQGEVAAVDYAGDKQDTLIASGSLALSDNTISNVAKYSFTNATWSAIGANPELPGPVTALTVNNRNVSSLFAAGRSYDGSFSYLSFWNGISWTRLESTLQGTTNVSQLTMVPLQDTHAANGVIEPDRMLMVSGLLSDSSFGNASSALFDGHTFIPYIVSTSSTGTPGSVSSLFHSFATFSFIQHHFLATGVVILISIAIAAGVVFVLAMIGILWTLFSRRDESMNKLGTADFDDDDDSAQHRPSSLLEHINAATRTTILGANNPFVSEKDEKAAAGAPVDGPDASNYVRAETPSDAVGGILAAEDEASRPAYARYSFDGAGEGEMPLSAGMEVEVLDDRDAAWWYARDARTGKEGVVPAAYLY